MIMNPTECRQRPGRARRPSRRSSATLAAILGATVHAGCAGPSLPPTPNLYLQGATTALVEMPPDRQTVEIELLYATDRMPVEDAKRPAQRYGDRRSPSLAVGRATVRLGNDLPWEAVRDESLDPSGRRIPVELARVEELVRFPTSMWMPVRIDGELRDDPRMLEAIDVAQAEVHDLLSRRLSTSERKEVFVYVHGVRNTFDDPLYRMAELWHFLGRPGVPVVYTWPARESWDALVDYTYARESSEFTAYHFRQFLLAVASCPDVERIHILAHSRGTGITLHVLRDFRLIYGDRISDAREQLKLGNVILAAPDIDLDVANQLFHPDRVHDVLDRMTVYLTPEDKALGLAEWLFSGAARTGSARVGDLSSEEVEALKSDRLGLDPIEVKVRKKGAHGHTYWIDNPAVLSDVILILRDDRPPGRKHGRPLSRADSGLWELHDGYPYGGAHADDNETETLSGQ
jgi:esterase/lipase superfamily enzyme